jgi:uncharacterized protein with GYD domain
MPKYLLKVNYNANGVKGVLKEGGSSRREAASQLIESVGGKLESFYFAWGDVDVYAVADMPDEASAAAAALAVSAGGGATCSTVVLIDPTEVDKASQKTADYRPPGA